MKSFLSLPTIVYFIVSVVFVTLGDYLGKEWSISKSSWLLVLAVGCSTLSGLFYFPLLLKEKLVVTSMLWTFLSIAGFLLVGLVIFKETLTSIQSIGLVMGAISIVLLSL
jgi:multidrug transporter EmrE-like cation transporter